MDDAGLRHRLLAILAADAAGYSRLMTGDDAATVASLDAARKVFRERTESHGGRVIDMAGDSVLAVFEAVQSAVNASLAIQRDLFEQTREQLESRRMRFRIGVHLGDVIEKRDGTVYGDGVNVASRLQALAEPGGIIVSQAVRDAVSNRVHARFQDIGEQSVKNVAQSVRAFRAMPQQLREGHDRQAAAATDATDASSIAPSRRTTSLPTVLDTLIGRRAEVEAVLHLLSEHRLVTMVGAGGIGKTALALEVAHRQTDRHADGVWWVDLAAVQSAESLVLTLAVATGISLPVASEVALAQALAGSRMMIVLDNCEHLAAHIARLLGPLLAALPGVSWLATSQETLALPSEHVYRLQGLGVPPTGVSLDEARSFGAFRLLEERARQIDQRFALDGASQEAAIDICRQLDGIALAIEMAAARLPALGATAVRSMLDQRLQWLRNRNRSAPTRQQTLRSTLEWSHSLLAPAEQRMLRHLAAFAGSFTLDLVLGIVRDDDLGEMSALDALCGLVERSLVQVESTQPVRYRLLESMRLFGLERLDEAGETRAVLNRHAAALAALALEAGKACSAQPNAEVLQSYDPHHADFQKAFDHACASQDGDIAASLLTGIRALVQLRGDILTMETRLLAVVPLLDSASPLARARILSAIASCGWVSSLKLSPGAAAAQAVDAWRTLGDTGESLHHALLLHALGLAQEGDISGAQHVLAQARLLEDRCGPMNPLFSAIHAAWIAMFAEDGPAFRDRLAIALSLAHAKGAHSFAIQIQSWQPRAALMAGDLDEAIALGEATAAHLRELRQRDFLPNALYPLLTALLLAGKVERARQVAAELWPLAVGIEHRLFLIDQLAALGKHLQLHATAARLRGYADAERKCNDLSRPRDEETTAQTIDVAIEAAVGADPLRRWRGEGALLGGAEIEDIVKELLAAPA